MKILRVIGSVNPERGGPIEGIKQLAEALRGLGVEVEVASLDLPDARWVRDFPLKVYALGPARAPALGRAWREYGFAPRLVTWLRTNAPHFDAVIVSGVWQFHSFATWLALRGRQTPYFVYPHGMLDPWFRRNYPLKHIKKWLYWPWAEYRVLRDAKAVLFTCEEERLLARESFWLYRCRELVVGYGTSAPAGDPDVQCELFLNRFPELREKKLLLFLGRIHEKKGCDLLVSAFARVAGRDEKLHLVMAGPDHHGLGERLAAEAASMGIGHRVTWTGMLAGDLKNGALRTAEAMVLPSHQENFGISVVESLACGIPVLVSKKVNIWREIETDGAGIVGDDTPEGIEAMLRCWVELPEDSRKTMAANALACFQARFTIKVAAEDIVRVIYGTSPPGQARFQTPEGKRERSSISPL